MIYTVKNGCMEEPEMPYEDGARTIFLYTEGTKGNPPKELKELLYYIEYTTESNAKNADLAELHRMVHTVKSDAEVMIAYMKLMEDERVLLERGREEGKAEGLAEGKAKGLAEGKAEGLAEGKAESILELLEDLGTISDELRERISLETDLATLKMWHKAAAKAESLEAFQKTLL